MNETGCHGGAGEGPLHARASSLTRIVRSSVAGRSRPNSIDPVRPVSVIPLVVTRCPNPIGKRRSTWLKYPKALIRQHLLCLDQSNLILISTDVASLCPKAELTHYPHHGSQSLAFSRKFVFNGNGHCSKCGSFHEALVLQRPEIEREHSL